MQLTDQFISHYNLAINSWMDGNQSKALNHLNLAFSMLPNLDVNGIRKDNCGIEDCFVLPYIFDFGSKESRNVLIIYHAIYALRLAQYRLSIESPEHLRNLKANGSAWYEDFNGTEVEKDLDTLLLRIMDSENGKGCLTCFYCNIPSSWEAMVESGLCASKWEAAFCDYDLLANDMELCKETVKHFGKGEDCQFWSEMPPIVK